MTNTIESGQTPEIKPVFSPESQLFGAIYDLPPAPIPDELVDLSMTVATELFGRLSPRQAEAISAQFGFENQSLVGASRQAFSGYRKDAMKKLRGLQIWDPLYRKLEALAPVNPNLIRGKIFGNVTNQEARLNAEDSFDYSLLSDAARMDLERFVETRGYRHMLISLLTGIKDPGLMDSTIEELRREIANQIKQKDYDVAEGTVEV